MKLAVSTYSLSQWRREAGKSLEQCLAWIAGTGVGAVEFAGLDDTPPADPVRRAKALRRRCDALGLKIVSYCSGGELLVPPAEQRQAVEKLKRRVDVAAELGVPSMRHDVTRGPKPAGGEGGKGGKDHKGGRTPTFARVLESVVPAVREVCEYARGLGVKTSLENHGFYLQTPQRVEQLILAVGSPNFGLTMDMGNFMVVNGDAVEAVRLLAKYAVMVHVKDFHVRPKATMPPHGWLSTPTPIALRGAVLGHGVLDVPAQLRHLKRAGYDGYLSLEFEGMEEPTKAVTWGLEYLRDRLGLGAEKVQ